MPRPATPTSGPGWARVRAPAGGSPPLLARRDGCSGGADEGGADEGVDGGGGHGRPALLADVRDAGEAAVAQRLLGLGGADEPDGEADDQRWFDVETQQLEEGG